MYFLDQAIPAGLHVRLNIETGKKEAKLMDGDDGHKYWKSSDKQGSVTRSNSGLSKRERPSEQISPKYDV
jgi:nucleotide exchange factor SIL1